MVPSPATRPPRRRRWLAGTTSAALLVTAVASAATAAPLTDVHDFAGGDAQGWFSYANAGSVTSSAESGELCAVVEGGENPWDVALQHDDVTFDRDTTYTVSFDAHASTPVTVPVQGGLGYPAAFGHQVVLDGTPTPQHVELTFSPADWPTRPGTPGSPVADDWSTGTGQVSFQLGGQAAPYTFCVDDFSLTSGARIDHSFAGGDLGAFDLYDAAGGGTARAGTDGLSACIDLRGGYANPYEAGLELKHVDVVEGRNYELRFTAYASDPAPVNVIVGQFGEPWHRVLDDDAALTTTPQTFTYPFTADATFSADPSTAYGRIQLELGRRTAPYTFCVSELSFTETTEPPPPYEPDTGSRVRVNQVGYLTEGPKRATLVTTQTGPVAWELVSGSTVVASGSTTPRGTDQTAGVDVHVVDFGDVTTPGTYTLRADGETSHPFVIGDDLYQQLRYDALDYFYPVRSGIAIDGSILGDPRFTRPAGHVGRPGDAGANQGDDAVPCITPTEAQNLYGDWTCDYTLDVTGGWYDAGDHGKYVVNGGIAVAQVMSAYERALHAPTGDVAALGDGTLDIPLDEQTNGVPDPLDEARWELEWMLRMQVPAGQPLAGMVHHKVHDVDWTGLPLLPSDDPQGRRLHRPSTAATLNLAAAAAQGARLWEPYDAGFAAELLDAARTAYAAAVATPDLYAPAPNADPSPGGGPYDDTDVSDEFYWAAGELFLTTGEPQFRDAVLANELHTADIFSAGGMYWGETAALGRMDLAVVESEIPGRTAIRQSVVDGAETYLARQAAQPFGTAYAGTADGVYEWGSNSAVLNNQVVLGTAFDLTGDQRFADAVLESMDYLLGRNGLNLSYVTGYGDVFSDDQHSRWFAHSLTDALPNPPVGSVAGGPNSDVGTWDPVIGGLYGPDHMCAPQLCYVDDIQSWSTNEITVNWNSALSWVASFVADQGRGDASAAGTVAWVRTGPSDVTVADGAQARLAVDVAGSPAPTVQWQRLVGGTWTDVPGATGTTFAFTARTADSGARFRVHVVNAFGGAWSDPATLTVTAPGTPGAAGASAAGGALGGAAPTSAGARLLATTGADPWPLLGVGLLLVAAGAGAVVHARRARASS
ncbi:glycoside hydrolase family 9 protein [Cellulomonas fimi]|uniref:Endoglucanase n=1 Tax=Cellulomonas fimi (strain ATCC 484 / DSM 20113 / JCM 1341 / CCUG 24087 / LMG 16345 / NBRC 15513 / NCIMB 8980 / NCTC 7547 / NRS-133) TaxID=590998 RepID=F4H8F6_CELFA|nr:glycoside hydrolase family 9 protein [Cellulomonas fimi]AEE45837.1 glycoside hydrolase family 9 [Cellulomonas fimi ATCC 484]NNH07822.1 glycoside hydrolase [Cellulomonas fimi]VEH30745.1 Endoglucanase C precursor [Cellulomonas fimi]